MDDRIENRNQRTRSRRVFLKTAGLTAIAANSDVFLSHAIENPGNESAKPPPKKAGNSYESHAEGIRILPGQWRPHYPWEHIAWVSPSWSSQDYIWLDFPEAIFTNQGLLYLSHINPHFPTVFHDLPRIPWRQIANGLAFDRSLPNGIVFGGSVTKGKGSTVDLKLYIENGSSKPLKNITLQTCAYLRGIKEFSDYTMDNKFVHLPASGWVPMAEAMALPNGKEAYRVGWRTSGKAVASKPAAITLSNQGDRLFAMTWFKDTLSMVSNPGHPCVHADPQFKDLNPGESSSIHGKLIFFEGSLKDFVFENYI